MIIEETFCSRQHLRRPGFKGSIVQITIFGVLNSNKHVGMGISMIDFVIKILTCCPLHLTSAE